MLQKDEDILGNGFTKAQLLGAVTPKHQELIILPTEKCNFRCTYCYEDFEIGRMKPEIVTAVERYMDKRFPHLDSFHFSWFGGEPLLAAPVVLQLARHGKKLAQAHDVHFDGALTTNGYLLVADLFEELVHLGQKRFQITLDGMREAHDATRKRADGEGTFDVIWSNLLRMHASTHPFEVSLRLHVHPGNVESIEELSKLIARTFATDARFQVNFQHLRDLGGENGKALRNAFSAKDMPKITAHMKSLMAAAANQHLRESMGEDAFNALVEAEKIKASKRAQVPVVVVAEQSHGESQELAPGVAPYICYASRANSLLIRADGRIGKCTVAFNDDRNVLGYIDLDGSLIIDNDRFRPFLRGLESLNPSEAGCPIWGIKHSSVPAPQRSQTITLHRK